MLGDIYEKEIQRTRESRMNEGIKAKFITDATNKAADAYSRIILNYPVTDRANDAKRRLQELGRPVPTPTPDAVERDKNIENSRRGTGRFDVMMHNFHRAPDVKRTSQVGEPTMAPPQPYSAVQIVRDTTTLLTTPVDDNSSKISVEVRNGEVPKSQAAPRSDAQNAPAPDTQSPGTNTSSPHTTPAPAPASQDTGIPELKPMDSGNSQTPTNSSAPQAQGPGPSVTDNTGGANSGSAQSADAQNSSQDQAGSSSSSRKGKKKK
jgi:outer membrane protein assembly factor BamD